MTEEQRKAVTDWIKSRRDTEAAMRNNARNLGWGHIEMADQFAVLIDAVQSLYENSNDNKACAPAQQ